jgi:hypothetical protein
MAGSSSLHPVGDLSLLAAAATATQRPNCSESSSISKRRKTTPRRLDIVNYKAPKVGADDDDLMQTNHRSDSNTTSPNQDNSAINLSTRPPPQSDAAVAAAAATTKSIYVNKGSLLNIPNPSMNFVSSRSNHASSKLDLPSSPVALDMSRCPIPISSCSPSPPLQVASSQLPDAENASPNNMLEVKMEGDEIKHLPPLSLSGHLEQTSKPGARFTNC